MLCMNEHSCAGCMTGRECTIFSWALCTHSRDTDTLSRIRRIVSPGLFEVSKKIFAKRKENRDFLTLCGLVHFDSGNGHYWETSTLCVICSLIARQNASSFCLDTCEHSCTVKFFSTDLSSSVLQIPSIKRLAAITCLSPFPCTEN